MGLLDSILRKRPEQKKLPKSFPKITNEQILQELDALGISSKALLRNHKHKIAFSVFCYLFAYDLKLRIKIANHLAPALAGEKYRGYHEEEIGDIIELQSYFNNFRVDFLSDLTIYLTELYQVASSILETETNRNVTLATQLFTAAQHLDKWYMDQIEKRLSPKDEDAHEQHLQLFQQCKDVLDEVKEAGFNCFTKVLHANSSKFRLQNRI